MSMIEKSCKSNEHISFITKLRLSFCVLTCLVQAFVSFSRENVCQMYQKKRNTGYSVN